MSFTAAFTGDMFTAGQGLFPGAACTVRIGRTTIEDATCSGLDKTRASTEQGQVDQLAGTLRFPLADCPKPTDQDGGIGLSGRIDVKLYGETDWVTYRVLGTRITAGTILTATIENLNE